MCDANFQNIISESYMYCITIYPDPGGEGRERGALVKTYHILSGGRLHSRPSGKIE